MHELSIAQALITQLEDVLKREGPGRITRVTVALGTMAGVDRHALEFAFPLAAEDTSMAGTELVIEEIPARLDCADCGKSTFPENPFLICQHCKSQDVHLAAGRELTVKSAELETPG